MDRRLYDLCRKYKYFYNKHKDVKSWDKKYHDIDLSSAVEKTASQLSSVEDELLMELFEIYMFYPMSIDTEREVPYEMNLFRKIKWYPPSHSKIEVRNAERFINVLSKHMYNWRCHNEMR